MFFGTPRSETVSVPREIDCGPGITDVLKIWSPTFPWEGGNVGGGRRVVPIIEERNRHF